MGPVGSPEEELCTSSFLRATFMHSNTDLECTGVADDRSSLNYSTSLIPSPASTPGRLHVSSLSSQSNIPCPWARSVTVHAEQHSVSPLSNIPCPWDCPISPMSMSQSPIRGDCSPISGEDILTPWRMSPADEMIPLFRTIFSAQHVEEFPPSPSESGDVCRRFTWLEPVRGDPASPLGDSFLPSPATSPLPSPVSSPRA